MQSPRITKIIIIKNRTEVFDFQKILLTTLIVESSVHAIGIDTLDGGAA